MGVVGTADQLKSVVSDHVLAIIAKIVAEGVLRQAGQSGREGVVERAWREGLPFGTGESGRGDLTSTRIRGACSRRQKFEGDLKDWPDLQSLLARIDVNATRGSTVFGQGRQVRRPDALVA